MNYALWVFFQSFVEDDWNTNKDFFKALGSRDKEIRSAEPDDESEVVREDQEVLLYRWRYVLVNQLMFDIFKFTYTTFIKKKPAK